jgi:hypothetical protein
MNSMLCRWLVTLFSAAALHAQTPPPAHDCAASGTVVNAITGEAVADAMVTIGLHGAGAATDANGKWSVSDLLCEPVTLVAKHPGFFQGVYKTSHSAPNPSNAQLVSGTPATDLKIAMIPEGAISGRVQDANGNPIEFADVEASEFAVTNGKRAFRSGQGTVSNGRGEFRIDGVGPGRYVVCAKSGNKIYPVGGGAAEVYLGSCYPGEPSAGAASTGTSSTIEIRGREEQVSLTLRTAQALHVRGKVTGTSPPRSIKIELAQWPGDPLRMRSSDGRPDLMTWVHEGFTDEDGGFDLADVPPGEYRAEAITVDGEVLFAETRINIGNADLSDVRLALAPMGSIAGNVRFETSKPLPAGSSDFVPLVQILSGGRIDNSADPVWEHLNFKIANVAPGDYVLDVIPGALKGMWVKSATLHGRDVLTQPMRVDGAAGPVEIVLTDAVSGVDITTKDVKGNPADGTIVMKTAAGGTVFAQTQKGYVEKQGVPPGEYKVWAFDDLSTVPWADDEWMAQNAGPGEKVTVVSGEIANAAVTVTAAPE